jgi:hypothetical protein
MAGVAATGDGAAEEALNIGQFLFASRMTSAQHEQGMSREKVCSLV